MNESNIMSVIVTFDVSEVSKNTESVLRHFCEMDDGLDMGEQFYKEASKALLERILRNEEIHLLATEAEFLKKKMPNIVKAIEYYNDLGSN
ncbi:hypothetical protein OMR72_003409 [Vibrio parahaemolyticus]|uniref:hypothetical protein n=2 Tax=Vibrio parahaemolyticus TaxID=670 RepID=UPI001120E6D3|nr:hypothetical protein [Vibrio parahaemolyticus]EGQ8540898.1 hypothetical protein [Vibrio parahaemolyticus]EKA8935148.1 hypothetical protein [Vibrio parahaemolyticus]MBE4164538.1 hypothetical protein [Vibrio parahaemolyticus]MDF4907287.1 hypothetical protein [Vibrio parahaemolyticus]HCE5105593.1 hypothetical protein [Vibrio parahaemolyticus]